MIFSNQVTTVTIVDFEGRSNKWYAFTQMGIMPFAIKANGLQQFKLMGSGADNGFGAKPNFGRYALVAIWEDRQSAEIFFKQNKRWAGYINRASKNKIFMLHNTMAHGTWGGTNPFEKGSEHKDESTVAVITRATIKWQHMWRFWQNVPDSSKDILAKEGLQFAIGIGEWPLRFQATFSVWDNSHCMKKFAYESKQHTEMIKKTKSIGWYKEELFSRFAIIEN
jgi:hypothetical protein